MTDRQTMTVRVNGVEEQRPVASEIRVKTMAGTEIIIAQQPVLFDGEIEARLLGDIVPTIISGKR